eukprot:m.1049202 g.1049202  ORF g.1049202 m.1049202 type:complete len:648 (+) comp24172_c0_seq75:270-2213(+)
MCLLPCREPPCDASRSVLRMCRAPLYYSRTDYFSIDPLPTGSAFKSAKAAADDDMELSVPPGEMLLPLLGPDFGSSADDGDMQHPRMQPMFDDRDHEHFLSRTASPLPQTPGTASFSHDPFRTASGNGSTLGSRSGSMSSRGRPDVRGYAVSTPLRAINYDYAMAFPRTFADTAARPRVASLVDRFLTYPVQTCKDDYDGDVEVGLLNHKLPERSQPGHKACEGCHMPFGGYFSSARKTFCRYCARVLCARCTDRKFVIPSYIINKGDFQVHAICLPCENHLQQHLYTPAIEFNRISATATKAIGEQRLDAIRRARDACMKHIYYNLLPSCPSRHAVLSLIPQDCIPYVSIFPGTQGARVSLADLCELQTRHIQLAMTHVEQLLRNHVSTCTHCVAVVRPCSADTSCTLRTVGVDTPPDGPEHPLGVPVGTADDSARDDSHSVPQPPADAGIVPGSSLTPETPDIPRDPQHEEARTTAGTNTPVPTTTSGSAVCDQKTADAAGLVTPTPMSPPATPDTSMLQAHYNQLRHDLMNLSNFSNFSGADTSGSSVLDHVGFLGVPGGVSPAAAVPHVDIGDDIVICRTCAKFCHRACFRSAEAQCLRCVYFRPDVMPALVHFAGGTTIRGAGGQERPADVYLWDTCTKNYF